MGLGGYAPTEDLVYTTLEIAASIAALHVACRYDLRRWIALCSLKLSRGPVQSRAAPRRPIRDTVANGFSTYSLWLGQWNIISSTSGLGDGWFLNTVLIGDLIAYMGVGVYRSLAFPLPQIILLGGLGGSAPSLTRHLLQFASGANRLRFALALLLPPAFLLSTYHGLRVPQPVMTAAWVLGALASMQSTRMEMKRKVLWINGIVVAGTALYTFIPPLQSYISFVFRTREPDHQPIWILRLWLSLCPAVPAIIVGMLLSPALRFDMSRDGGAIRFPDINPDGSVFVPLSIGPFPDDMYRVTMIGFIASRLTSQFTHKEGSRQISDLTSTLPAVISVSLVMFLKAWSGGHGRAWWDYSEEWTLPRVPSGEDDDAKAEVTSDDEGGRHPKATSLDEEARL